MGSWNRDLQADLRVIQNWGADVLVTLVEKHELESLGVFQLGNQAAHFDLDWLHLPIVDVSTPDNVFEMQWQKTGPDLRRLLYSGGRCVLHCKGGLGRTGTIAARLLVESGMEPQVAIKAVRQSRSGAIETAGQERYIHGLAGQL